MSRNADILSELEVMGSRLAYAPRQTPFIIPETYLEQLAAALSAGVQFSMSDDSALPGFSKELPFEVSEAYFTTLADDLARHAIDSLPQEIATPFKAPAGYFENLPDKLLASAQEVDQPVLERKTIELRPSWRRIARIAAAAVFILGIGFGSYQYLHPATPESIAARQLSKVDELAINNYVAQNMDDFDSEILESAVASSQAPLPASVSSLDEAAIEEYFQENAELTPAATGEQTL